MQWSVQLPGWGTSSPVVYVAFGNADIARYSHDGDLIWVTRYMLQFGDPGMAWGYGVSPLVLEQSVLFPWDHHEGPCYLIGLDKRTGEISWKRDRPIGISHSTPLIVEHHGRVDILVSGKNRLTAFDTGREQYRQRLGGDCNSSPIAGEGRIYLSNNEGSTFVVRAGREFELMARNELGERITASPAISGDQLIYRTDSHLYCIAGSFGAATHESQSTNHH